MKRCVLCAILVLMATTTATRVAAVPTSIMLNTKHDLSFRPTGTAVRASSSGATEICAFCHTPHSARADAPLWNRFDVTGPYTLYNSDVMKQLGYPSPDQPTSTTTPFDVHVKTRICLSCHDGTIAIGHLVNLPQGFTFDIGMTGSAQAGGKLLQTAAGYIGLDLSDDHPVAVKFLGPGSDPELQNSMGGNVRGYDSATGNKTTASGPTVYVECTSCHDAHDNTNGNFLVMPNHGSQLCTACHSKTGYSSSVHDSSSQGYSPPDGIGGTLGTSVGAVKCMDCHFPHKAGVQPNTPTTPNADLNAGSKYLLSFQEENSCFNNPSDRWNTSGAAGACHGNGAGTLGTKRDIQTEAGGGGVSGKTSAHHVGSYNNFHKATEGKDYNPNGWLSTTQWHVECQDCHNPHTAGNAVHAPGTNTVDAASVLYGAGGARMQSWPAAWTAPAAINFTYLEPIGVTTAALNSPSYEYEVCFKCHSSFSWGAGVKPTTATFTTLTDQAMEFNPSNASYHAVAGASKAHNQGAYLGGWAYNSTMTCSDCHGNDGSTIARGPHGSTNTPILIRRSDPSTVGQNPANDLCYVCHDAGTYYYGNNAATTTGFRDSTGTKNFHYEHMNPASLAYKNGVPKRCTGCHSSPSHGSSRSHIISYTADGAPYGTYSSLTRYTDPGSGLYVAGSCSATACHAGSHP